MRSYHFLDSATFKTMEGAVIVEYTSGEEPNEHARYHDGWRLQPLTVNLQSQSASLDDNQRLIETVMRNSVERVCDDMLAVLRQCHDRADSVAFPDGYQAKLTAGIKVLTVTYDHEMFRDQYIFASVQFAQPDLAHVAEMETKHRHFACDRATAAVNYLKADIREWTLQAPF